MGFEGSRVPDFAEEDGHALDELGLGREVLEHKVIA